MSKINIFGFEIEGISAILIFIGAAFIFLSLAKIDSFGTIEIPFWNNIILLLVGFCFLTLGICIELYQNKNTSKMIVIIIPILAIIAMFSTVGPMQSYFGTETPTPTEIATTTPEIKINYKSDTAQFTQQISGIAKNIPEGYELWILVYPYSKPRYYPENQLGNIQNGEWSVHVVIGTKDSVGEKFDILAVLADQNARTEFTSYIVNCEKTNKWPGIYIIPDGAKVYSKITVIRV